MNSKLHYSWILLLIPLFFIAWYLLENKQNSPVRNLPFYGPKQFGQKSDTLFHRIGSFSLVNQFGQITDSNSVKGKIYVSEFFFTTCQSICPVMNSNLTKVHRQFGNRPDFLILSHTVDPEQDSVSVLKAYADRFGVRDSDWLFLTGNKKELYELARKGYLLNAEKGDGGSEDFIHTQNFALVDKEKHIRGYYDGTDSVEVARLISDIKLLYKEYDFLQKTAD